MRSGSKNSVSTSITIKIITIIISVIVILLGTMKIINDLNKAPISSIMPKLGQEDIGVVMEDSILELSSYPRNINNRIYLPVKFVQKYINSYFFWDEREGILTYTTEKDVIRMKTDSLTYFINDEPIKLHIPITTLNKEAYIPLELVTKFCKYKFTYIDKHKLLMVDDMKINKKFVNVITKKGYIRTKPNEDSPYLKKIYKHDELRIFDNELKLFTEKNWIKVRTKEGIVGYINKKSIGDSITEESSYNNIEENEEHEKYKNIEGKINMAWHQVTNVVANNKIKHILENTKGVDIISPTWFHLSDSSGIITNYADIKYVNFAHENGYQVWGLFSNSFNSAITHDVLSSTKKRQNVIKQILAYSAIYELDGINIDFEKVSKKDGAYFVQFIRELTPYLKRQGLTVSVDMYVPKPWTAHYNRTEVGKIVDYIIIMGYDEHWATSPKSGSVASINFVEKGIVDTLKEVPNNKVILGIPYYTRLWKETVEEGKKIVSSQAYSMNSALNILKERNIEAIWNNEVEQYYGEYIEGKDTYKIWLEEEKSIEEKVKLVNKYGLQGISGWKIGLEKEEVWEVLNNYLK
jgi:spore germination protein YaaH